MKITDLELLRYGVYQGESFRPAADRLTVVMGENESGKTTLLHFIRDMLFGYRRGAWQNREGHMGFIRDNGEAWRVFRQEKESWFEDASGEVYREELPLVWWHGLSRKMYEKIFAVGLEDLQGAGFLSQEDVRSRFFLLQGGDRLADARKDIGEEMERLLLPSAQGKRKINQLMETVRSLREELDRLSSQEEDFSRLQKEQETVRREIAGLEARLAGHKDEDKALEKRLGAWQYYVRAREIKRQLSLSEQVRLFPKNGKEQWNQLMNRMETLHDQRQALQKKLDAYTPKTKEEIIPWADSQDALERLYTDLGQWNRTIEELEELRRDRQAWKAEFCHMGYALPLWDRMLSVDEEFSMVDWEEGRKLAQSVTIRENELHFWEKREPAIEESSLSEEEPPRETEEEWHAFEETANAAEALVHDERDLREEREALSRKEEARHTVWFWIGILAVLCGAGGAAAFFTALAGYAALYAAGGLLAASGICFYADSRLSHKKEKEMKALEEKAAELAALRKRLGEGFPLALPADESGIPVFRNALQQKRAEFYEAQARAQAYSWKMESLERQKNEHRQWEEEGKDLKKEEERARKAWTEWLSRNRLPAAAAGQLSELQEQWQKLYTAQGAGKIIDVRIEKAEERRDGFVRRALAIIRKTGMNLEASPETVADLYEENQKRLLSWQSFAEKNRQHSAYEAEMKELESQWESCGKSVKALFAMVNADNAEEFAERVTAHEQHDQLTKDWAEVRKDIRLYAGSDADFEALWKSLESGEYDEWMEQHRALEKTVEEEEAALGGLRKQQGAIENEIYRLAGDDTVTGVLQRKDEAETELSAALAEWLAGRYALHFLEKAQEQYESGKRPQILEKANSFLQAMTSGRYQLAVSEDGKDVYTVDAVHHRKDAKIWSSGTGDQVYLALRLSMALAFGKQLESLPLVLDDIFVRFDETRQKETLRFLMDLGKEQQIFLFTCHEQTMRLAEEIGREKQTGSFIRLRNGRIISEETI